MNLFQAAELCHRDNSKKIRLKTWNPEQYICFYKQDHQWVSNNADHISFEVCPPDYGQTALDDNWEEYQTPIEYNVNAMDAFEAWLRGKNIAYKDKKGNEIIMSEHSNNMSVFRNRKFRIIK